MEWNEERVATLTKLWREGQSAAQVARYLGGVSRCAVIGKVRRLGIGGRDTPSRPPGGRPSARARVASSGVRGATASRAPRAEGSGPPGAPFEATPTASLLTLTSHACRWPIGDPDAADFGFCGRTKAADGAYCAGHAAMSKRGRERPMKAREIDRLAGRFAEGSAVHRDLRPELG